jgi:hypothetical protein
MTLDISEGIYYFKDTMPHQTETVCAPGTSLLPFRFARTCLKRERSRLVVVPVLSSDRPCPPWWLVPDAALFTSRTGAPDSTRLATVSHAVWPEAPPLADTGEVGRDAVKACSFSLFHAEPDHQ